MKNMGHMIDNIYYTVEKQLDDIDGIGTTNGLADIYLYVMKNNTPIRIGDLCIKIGFMGIEEEISDFIDEFVPEYDSNKLKFIRL